MMVNNRYRKHDPFFVKKAVVQILFQFAVSAIIGSIYGFMMVNETIGGYINKLLPSMDGPDLHLYLPVVVTVFIYSYFIQKKQRILLEKISFSCLHILVALNKLYFFSCCVIGDLNQILRIYTFSPINCINDTDSECCYRSSS